MTRTEIKNKLIDCLIERDEIVFAYLFGSFLKTDDYHDIDIAVFISDRFLKDNSGEFTFGYESLIAGSIIKVMNMHKIDVVLLNNAPLLITNRIINKGELLFEKDRFKRIAFENYYRKLFIDTENFRKIKTYYLKNKINKNA